MDREEIQQIVDWHSPIEQKRDGIVKGVGLRGRDFLENNLGCCEIESYEEYTTFFERPTLMKFPFIQKLLRAAYGIFFPGNLYR